jgi:hypothetical protein
MRASTHGTRRELAERGCLMRESMRRTQLDHPRALRPKAPRSRRHGAVRNGVTSVRGWRRGPAIVAARELAERKAV